MADSPTHDDLERRLDALSSELRSVDSLLPGVQRRIAGKTIRPPLHLARYGMAAAAALLLGIGWWAIHHQSTPPEALRPLVTQAPPALIAQVPATEARLDGLIVSEHLAIAIGNDAVLVAWSHQGGSRPRATNRRAAAYHEFALGTGRLPDGRTVVWSLFVAQPSVVPVLQPPAIGVAAADGRVMQFSVLPSPARLSQVQQRIQSAHLPGEPKLADIQNLIERGRSSLESQRSSS